MVELDNLYSELILDLYKHPVNQGKLENPSLKVSGGNPACGDMVTLYLSIKDGVIIGVKFEGKGCAIFTASASLLTEKLKGMKVQDALSRTDQEVFKDLGNIIQTRIKCALLPQYTLQEGLKQHEKDPSLKNIEDVRI